MLLFMFLCNLFGSKAWDISNKVLLGMASFPCKFCISFLDPSKLMINLTAEILLEIFLFFVLDFELLTYMLIVLHKKERNIIVL